MIKIDMSTMTAFLAAKSIMKQNLNDDFGKAREVALAASTGISIHNYDEAFKIYSLGISVSDPINTEKSLREILAGLVTEFDYPWKSNIKLGRIYVINSLSIDETQVFRNAGLINENFDLEVVKWWDSMAMQFPSEDLDYSFREWEHRSFVKEVISLENENCPYRPRWLSVQDNNVGYDILTYRKLGEVWCEHFLEVKSSSTGLTRFFISANEGRKIAEQRSKYTVHFWNTNTEQLTEFDGDFLANQLPINQGLGTWERVKIIL